MTAVTAPAIIPIRPNTHACSAADGPPEARPMAAPATRPRKAARRLASRLRGSSPSEKASSIRPTKIKLGKMARR
jgi:hypothetical protein